MLVKSDTRYRAFNVISTQATVIKRGTAVGFSATGPSIEPSGVDGASIGFLDEDYDPAVPKRGAAVCLHEPSQHALAGAAINAATRVNVIAAGKVATAAAGPYTTFAAASGDGELVEIFAIRANTTT